MRLISFVFPAIDLIHFHVTNPTSSFPYSLLYAHVSSVFPSTIHILRLCVISQYLCYVSLPRSRIVVSLCISFSSFIPPLLAFVFHHPASSRHFSQSTSSFHGHYHIRHPCVWFPLTCLWVLQDYGYGELL